MKKLLLYMAMLLIVIGCNNEGKINRDNQLPVVSISSEKYLSKTTISDINSIKKIDNKLSFAYYTADRLTKEGNKRWYISQIDGSLKAYVFSLMPIVDGKAGWGEVSNNGASIDIFQNKITIGNIADNYDHTYKDWGIDKTVTDSIIQEDIELIRNATVDIKWWFFKASNNNWYIVNENSIYKFASKNGAYDWQKVDLEGFTIKFFIENNSKKMKLVKPNNETPQLNLNHKSEKEEIQKQSGCEFDDIYPNMFSEDKKEENYIRAICQAGVMQGDESQSLNFKPFDEVDRYTVAKVTSLVYNYEEVTKFCAKSKYSNDKESCYIDYATSKGFNTKPLDEKIRKGEFYQYLVKIFWNKNIDNYDNSWDFLKNKGVLLKADLNEPAGQLYVPDFMYNYLKRWELATLVMRCSRVSKEELPNASEGKLPYSITPDNKEISDIEILQFIYDLLADLLSDDEEFLSELNATLFEDDKAEERESTFFIPKNSLPTPVKVDEVSEVELPNAIVKTAKENLGKTVPYVDGKNSIDTRLITTVYGQEVKHDSAKEMCQEYEDKGKLEPDLPTDKDLKGYVVCYKENTPGTNGEGHVAIISDSKGEKEIGVQDTQNGVMERPTDKENIKGVIAPKDIDLPSF